MIAIYYSFDYKSVFYVYSIINWQGVLRSAIKKHSWIFTAFLFLGSYFIDHKVGDKEDSY